MEKGQLEQDARDAAVGRLSLTTDLADFADCDLVIEAIVEDLAPKQELFAELERVCRPDAVLATNTSALSVTEIAAATSTPERVVGMHFFNPAPLMPLVEIIRAELTDDDAFEAAFAFGEKLGKHPIRCYDTPGFVVNRVLIPLLNDCIRVLDEARVTVEDLDAGMKHGAGWPMGPCELSTSSASTCTCTRARRCTRRRSEPRMAAPPRLVAMRERGAARPQERPRLLQLLGREADGCAPGRRRLTATGGRRAARRAPRRASPRAWRRSQPRRGGRDACSGETPAARSAAASASIRSVTFRAVDSGRMS